LVNQRTQIKELPFKQAHARDNGSRQNDRQSDKCAPCESMEAALPATGANISFIDHDAAE
jgi:hypothetical protein